MNSCRSQDELVVMDKNEKNNNKGPVTPSRKRGGGEVVWGWLEIYEQDWAVKMLSISERGGSRPFIGRFTLPSHTVLDSF